MGRLRIRKAFTLVELMIVVSILGILGAIVLPAFGDHIQKAKEAAAKDNLRILRNAINIYAAQHNDVPPGYISDNPLNAITAFLVKSRLVDGNCISAMPENPFNELSTIKTINNGVSFPTEATGTYGWVYKPETKEIRLDWTGNDSTGQAYFSY